MIGVRGRAAGAVILLAFLGSSCSNLEPKEKTKRTGGGVQPGVIDKDNPATPATTTTTGGVVADPGAASSASQAAFTDTLHPLLVAHCGSCHGAAQAPKFAVAAPDAAFKVVTESQLVSLSAVPASRLVARLGQFSHNCWSECAADAKSMEDAIRAWLAKGGSSDATGGAALIKLGAVPIASAKEFSLKGGYNGNWVVAAGFPKAIGDRLAPKEDLTSSQRTVLARIEKIDPVKPEQGGAFYFFDIPATPAKYQVWFRAKNTGDGQRVFFHINGRDSGAGAPYRQPEQNTINTKYVWIPGFVATPEGKTVPEPVAQDLKPMTGLNQLMLEVPDTEADVDMIALTTNAAFDQSSSVNAGRRNGWTFDLTALLGHKAILSLQLSETTDGKAYVLSRPTIETEEPIKIKAKTMYVILNGELNKQLSTFASTDVTLTGSGELSHGDMLVPIQAKETDTIEIGFEVLVVVP